MLLSAVCPAVGESASYGRFDAGIGPVKCSFLSHKYYNVTPDATCPEIEVIIEDDPLFALAFKAGCPFLAVPRPCAALLPPKAAIPPIEDNRIHHPRSDNIQWQKFRDYPKAKNAENMAPICGSNRRRATARGASTLTR